MTHEIDHLIGLRAGFDDARAVLEQQTCELFAPRVTPEQRAARQVETTLTIDLSRGGVHHDVVIEVGLPMSTDEQVSVPVHWQAAGHDRFFPIFDGDVVLRPRNGHSEIELRGRYVPPLGVVGRLGDRAGAWRAAERSATALLEQAAERVEHEVRARREEIAWHPAAYHESLRDRDPHVGPENYLG